MKSKPGTSRTGPLMRKRRWPMRSRLISAFFAGKYRVCGKSVAKGEQVYFAKHYGIRCTGCGPHTIDDQPLPSKRGKKRRPAPASTPAARDLDVTDSNGRRAQRCADGI